ncbi:hypothetical protein [Streptomyces sp. S4.7]|uniref:hypothetical protein n=1 Tax=Streptomyces sp. S4.7 TaxID=2705439 RepID=UPI0013DB884F|nr:hypothetical protein [Streptomyces sp. S4.7]
MVDSLGDPPPEETVTQVLSDPLGVRPGPCVVLADLAVLPSAGDSPDSTASRPPVDGPDPRPR